MLCLVNINVGALLSPHIYLYVALQFEVRVLPLHYALVNLKWSIIKGRQREKHYITDKKSGHMRIFMLFWS
jgi:hypothetical protein